MLSKVGLTELFVCLFINKHALSQAHVMFKVPEL